MSGVMRKKEVWVVLDWNKLLGYRNNQQQEVFENEEAALRAQRELYKSGMVVKGMLFYKEPL